MINNNEGNSDGNLKHIEDKFNGKLQGNKFISDNKRKPKILFYDIETTPLKAYIWRLGGDQLITHEQLDDKHNNYGIICVSYAWNDNQPVKTIDWGYKQQNSKRVVEEFDKIANKADIVIGKNSDRFDVKHLNMQRLIAGLPGLPDWLVNTDDLEQQFRKNFTFPSFSLDYLAKYFLGIGKEDMKWSDWIDIVEKRNMKSYNKMLAYNRHDVEHTRKLWNIANAHFKPKYNMATHHGDECCVNCGSKEIKRHGVRMVGKTMYQLFYCNHHKGSAGKAPIHIKKGEVILGKLGQ